jgi:hypothetical protein
MIPSETILRAQRFDQLMREREQEFPNESYETRFQRVYNSKLGGELLAQMHHVGQHSDADAATSSNASSIPPVNGFKTSAEARQAFIAEFDKLHKNLSYDAAWNTAAGTSPSKEAYIAWKVLAKKEKNLPAVIVRTPASGQLPADHATKFRD